ncbi:Os04g0291800 [Oryza sativa Japonica Group]|uniref:Os04g0291800 protein n=2 Tax=Oryza sativa subsp. japonica TaxID=39947 RepID=Q7XMS8_ORYSJ|nr:Os04g0291800 [Oryza sativa Japonica Group]CAE04468.3 OSJNBa0029L02.9 [Oryza sativa Japonica Group]
MAYFAVLSHRRTAAAVASHPLTTTPASLAPPLSMSPSSLPPCPGHAASLIRSSRNKLNGTKSGQPRGRQSGACRSEVSGRGGRQGDSQRGVSRNGSEHTGGGSGPPERGSSQRLSTATTAG